MLCWGGWTRIYTEVENRAEDTNEEIREMSAIVGECQQLRRGQRCGERLRGREAFSVKDGRDSKAAQRR